MADIKIDEIEFYTFMNSVEMYIRTSMDNAPEEIKNSGKMILDTIKNYQDIADLKSKRKMYYDFYINNRKSNSIEANQAYKNYLEIKEELERRNSR